MDTGSILYISIEIKSPEKDKYRDSLALLIEDYFPLAEVASSTMDDILNIDTDYFYYDGSGRGTELFMEAVYELLPCKERQISVTIGSAPATAFNTLMTYNRSAHQAKAMKEESRLKKANAGKPSITMPEEIKPIDSSVLQLNVILESEAGDVTRMAIDVLCLIDRSFKKALVYVEYDYDDYERPYSARVYTTYFPQTDQTHLMLSKCLVELEQMLTGVTDLKVYADLSVAPYLAFTKHDVLRYES